MPDTSPRHGKSFDENIDILFDELVLATKWGRPSILLAVHKSRFGQDKAEKNLETRLAREGLRVARIAVNEQRFDVPHLIATTPQEDQLVFFISNIDWGGGEDGKRTYQALNMHRERFVEDRIKVVFWLTTAEARNLPVHAPDFWAFRHRVVEFISQRDPRSIPLPAGVLVWDVQRSVDPFDSAQEGIRAREELLQKLPRNMEALSTRIELYYSIAYLHWISGDKEATVKALKAGLELARENKLPELKAQLMNGLGIVEYESGAFAAALERFTAGLQFRSSSRSLLLNLSAALHMLGRNQEASAAGKKAIRANPTDAESWNRLGFIHAAMGKPDEAIICLKKAAELNPGAHEHHSALAVLYGVVDRKEEAGGELKTARQISGDQEAVYLDILEEGLLRDTEKARELLNSAVSSGKLTRFQVSRDPYLAILFAARETDLQQDQATTR